MDRKITQFPKLKPLKHRGKTRKNKDDYTCRNRHQTESVHLYQQVKVQPPKIKNSRTTGNFNQLYSPPRTLTPRDHFHNYRENRDSKEQKSFITPLELLQYLFAVLVPVLVIIAFIVAWQTFLNMAKFIVITVVVVVIGLAVIALIAFAIQSFRKPR